MGALEIGSEAHEFDIPVRVYQEGTEMAWMYNDVSHKANMYLQYNGLHYE